MKKETSNRSRHIPDIRDVRYVLPATAGHPVPVLEDIPGGAETNPQATRHDHTATA